jgi:hypothetical protein
MRRLAFVALLSLTAVSCAGLTTDEQRVLAWLDELSTRPHQFSFVETAGGVEFRVTGTVEDDFRRTATLSLDGVDVMEQIVSDDGLALRVLEPDLARGLSDLADPDSVTALESGQWVVDHVGAPDMFPPVTREGFVATGVGPLMDAQYTLAYLERAIHDGSRVEEHNPDNPEYQPLDDPFSEITETELSRSQGFRRFDIVPQSLASPAERGAEPPDVTHFRKISFFVRGDRIVKVLEEVSFERREFRRAREGRAPEFYLDLFDRIVAGGTQEPVRLRSMSYEITRLGVDSEVELPLEAHAGSLSGLLEAMGDQAVPLGAGPPDPPGPPEEADPPEASEEDEDPSGEEGEDSGEDEADG